MRLCRRALITGVFGYVPDYVLTNDELERMVDTSGAWILERTGIAERRLLKGEGAGSSLMGIEAVKGLLHKTKTDPQTIDMLICATMTPDMGTPATANLISYAVHASNAFSYDVQAACSGFLYALDIATQYIASGRANRVVVVGADKMSSVVDYKNRSSCILFGDGAGAVLVEPCSDSDKDSVGIIDSICRTDGSGQDLLYQRAGGSKYPASYQTIEAGHHYLYQDGQRVFKAAVQAMTHVVTEIMERNGLTQEKLSYFVPHQANKRILQAVAQAVGLPFEKVMVVLDKFGNTSAASIPLCLWCYEEKLKRGDQLILAAFGGGFTWGSTYMVWGYDGKQS